jgi:hypothetical protein
MTLDEMLLQRMREGGQDLAGRFAALVLRRLKDLVWVGLGCALSPPFLVGWVLG